MMSGLRRHRAVTHATQYAIHPDCLYKCGAFSEIKNRCIVPVIEVISTSFYELNIISLFLLLVVSVSNNGKNQPKKYRRYRYRYCESIADKVSVSVPIPILTSLLLLVCASSRFISYLVFAIYFFMRSMCLC